MARAIGLAQTTLNTALHPEKHPAKNADTHVKRLDKVLEAVARWRATQSGREGDAQPRVSTSQFLAERGAAGSAPGDVCLIRVKGPDGHPLFSYWLSGRTVQEGPPIEMQIDANSAFAVASGA